MPSERTKKAIIYSGGKKPRIADNREITVQEELTKIIQEKNIKQIDISVGFFYFSGWKLLAHLLPNIKVRILVGYYIDPNGFEELLSRVRSEGENVDLAPYRPRARAHTREAQKNAYVDGFARLFNESSVFDEGEEQDAVTLFENKLNDGSLELKMTNDTEHGKFYILHQDNSSGLVLMGSSNFTFRGLKTQGELNEIYEDKERFDDYRQRFERMWEDSENIDLATLDTKEEFIEKLEENLWIHQTPSPYEIYIRVLHELFRIEEIYDDIKTPSSITNNLYIDLEYQTDAIKLAMEKIQKYDGVIIADVVGLGKSIIASAVAHNLNMRTIIIAPPHLESQWDDYQAQFKLPGVQIFSSGNVKKVYEKYKESDSPLLIIVDEAHRFRNEDTNDYKLLHQITRSHPDNKVMLLTATPFNNDPKDVFALIKLFQTPGRSSIRSVDNLSIRFRDLIARYKKLNRERTKEKLSKVEIENEADSISGELRRLIETVVIRRSRLDLKHISRYRKDLEKQKIEFAEVQGPDLMNYSLGDLFDLYLDTLLSITGDKNSGFIGARYKPTTYIKDLEKFKKKYGEDLDESDLKTAQTNLASFMRRLLVMRFESSIEAFRSTLESIIHSNRVVLDWYEKVGKVPIMKKGKIPDPDQILEMSDNPNDELRSEILENEIEDLKKAKGVITIEKDELDDDYIKDLKNDLDLLARIYDNWFGSTSVIDKGFDPKADQLIEKIKELLEEDKNRKIVVFSSYADTVNYLHGYLTERGLDMAYRFTSSDSSTSTRDEIKKNFDASVPEKLQEDKYNVLIATDAISEGYNLHRAGVIINYDIPYNPTRVIQRIGRINRINKKVFDKLYVFNYFPTQVGEDITRIRQVSTLKMRLINAVIGSDIKTLTSDEEIQSFFKDEFEKHEVESEHKSWDADFKEDYERAIEDSTVFDKIKSIKPRSRVVRLGMDMPRTLAFGKKGDHSFFGMKEGDEDPMIVSSETALNFFKALPDEEGVKSDDRFDETFRIVRDKLFEKPEMPKISGRREDALKLIELIKSELPRASDYCKDLIEIIKKYDDISDGVLKDIAQLKVNDIENTYEQLKNLVPSHMVEVINKRVNRFDEAHEIILLSEEHRT